MNKQKQLTMAMGIFTFLVIVAFGSIIVTEKASIIMAPKIEKKVEKYINDKYKNVKDKVKISKTTYKNAKFVTKITDIKNKKHYFYVYYENKKMTDTYKKDYVEAKPFMDYLTKVIKNEIKQKTKKEYKIKMSDTYPNFTTMVQDRLLKEDNLSELRCYIIEDELIINKWTKEDIKNDIIKYINDLKNKKVTPNNFSLTITSKTDKNKSIKINNITIETANKDDFERVIDSILNKKNDNLVANNRIEYRYLK